MPQISGYKLIRDLDGLIIAQWGGNYGQCPEIPNPLVLPNGDQICAANVGVSYNGYTLQPWMMDDPRFYADVGVPKPIAECQAVQINVITFQANSLLSPYDWYAIRASEPNGTTIPANILSYRQAVRTQAKALGQEVNSLTDVNLVIAWQPHDWPKLT
jgi:hypothetical protein